MKKVISIICVICILALTVGGLAAVSSGFENWNVKTWFGRTPEDPAENPDDTSGVLVANAVSSKFMALASTAAAADGSVTINATVKDSRGEAEESLQSVTWSLAWAATPSNASLVPADFVELTVNNTSAKVKAKKPFGTKIELRCAATSKPSVFSVCSLDYLARMQYISMTMPDFGQTYAPGFDPDASTVYTVPSIEYGEFRSIEDYMKIKLINSITYTEGTIESTAPVRCSVQASAEFAAEYKKASGQDLITDSVSIGTFAGNDSNTPIAITLWNLLVKFTDRQISQVGIDTVATGLYNACLSTDNQVSVKIVCGDTALSYILNLDVIAVPQTVELDNSSVTL